MAEIIGCPSCGKKLQIPEAFFGKTVQCPECKHTFKAEPGGTSISNGPGAPTPSGKTPEWEKPAPSQARSEEEDRPRRRPRADEDDDEDRPRRRRDEDDDIGDSPRRRRRYLAPHRGGLVLTLGILSIVVCAIMGPIAWSMGNNDLAEIKAGRMDPEGEGMTQGGKICGIIGTISMLLGLVLGCLWIVMIAAIAGNQGRRF